MDRRWFGWLDIWLIGWLFNWPDSSLVNWSVGCMASCLGSWVIFWLWFFSRLFGWDLTFAFDQMLNDLAGWSTVCLFCCQCGQLAASLFAYQLVGFKEQCIISFEFWKEIQRNGFHNKPNHHATHLLSPEPVSFCADWLAFQTTASWHSDQVSMK